MPGLLVGDRSAPVPAVKRHSSIDLAAAPHARSTPAPYGAFLQVLVKLPSTLLHVFDRKRPVLGQRDERRLLPSW